MLCLVLDEGVSPAISPRLWAEGVDNYPLRDRGLLGLADHEIWTRAQQERRAVVTMNGVHFRVLARRDKRHAGLVIIPSGGTRDEHFELVMRGVAKVRAENAILETIADRIVEVTDSGIASIEITAVGILSESVVVKMPQRSGIRLSAQTLQHHIF